ncbi:ATP-dependent DNA helicase Q1-like isoform X2 [Dendronephthya gigantea]|nr:ATP-dependent DNA helicase Q1-like isoform X2 [Dendronephthya gigantea]
MAASNIVKYIGIALNSANFPPLNLKPLQVKCLEYILNGKDVIGVLPTGFGKSLIFHILPYFMPTKKRSNIVLVICPLNSIIEDQLKILKDRGISANVLVGRSKDRSEIEKLFSSSPATEDKSSNENLSHLTEEDYQIPNDILNGECSIVFAHPEALLSKEGRKLMTSQIYQDNVVACVIDEAHCVELWGEEFRTDFKDLSSLKAFFPLVPTIALTATASPVMLEKLKKSLLLASCKIVSVNPNRMNIYLEKKIRLSNNVGNESYRAIIEPIAQELAIRREKYPMTIIYLKLKYCGYAYSLFERILKDDQYVGNSKEPAGRLFAQFHSPQTDRMKKEIIREIKKEDSR